MPASQKREKRDPVAIISTIFSGLSLFVAYWAATHPTVIIVQQGSGSGTNGTSTAGTYGPSPVLFGIILLWVVAIVLVVVAIRRHRKRRADASNLSPP